MQWLRLSNGVLLIHQQAGPCITVTPKAQALSLLLLQLPQGALPLPWCSGLCPHAWCPPGEERGESKAAFLRALTPTLHVGEKGLHGLPWLQGRPGDEVRSCAQRGARGP